MILFNVIIDRDSYGRPDYRILDIRNPSDYLILLDKFNNRNKFTIDTFIASEEKGELKIGEIKLTEVS